MNKGPLLTQSSRSTKNLKVLRHWENLMNPSVQISKFLFFCWLLIASCWVPAQSQLTGEPSVPEPTRLSAAALAAGSKLIWSELVGKIESVDARATVSVIEVESSDGERVRGIKIMLENTTSTDQIYITENLLTVSQGEFESLELSRQRHANEECEAQRSCVRGIARCRPSQTLRQAYCLALYTHVAPHFEEGLALSTPRHSFRFPSIGPLRFSTLIGEAIQALE